MIKVASLNVNGLGNMGKFEKILITVKADIYCFQETNWDNNKMREVRKKWPHHVFVSHGSGRSCGVACLIKSNAVENVKEVYADSEGRVLIIEFEYQNCVFKLINVYGPNNEKDRRELFVQLRTLCTDNCICVGDFNVWCNRMDAANDMSYKRDSSRNELIHLMTRENLVDFWRLENPDKREYSRRQVVLNSLKQSRIDLCLVKQDIVQYMKNRMYRFTTYSDHAVLEFQVDKIMQQKGGGLWCLNVSLLNDVNYKVKIHDCIKSEWMKQLDSENVCVRWENLKQKMKILSTKYVKEKNGIERRDYKDMQKRFFLELEQVKSNPNSDLTNYLKIKSDLKKHEVNRCRGAIIRSRAKYALEGEKCTSFFLNMEKQNQSRSVLLS